VVVRRSEADTNEQTKPTARIPPRIREDSTLRAAFRDLHGARLHGFALLVSLGDSRRAAEAAAAALTEGEGRAAELRHPERAAAWLRQRVVRRLRRARPKATDLAAASTALAELGADVVSFAGLASLGPADRVALVASSVEGFEGVDLETILQASPAATRRRVILARTRYLEGVTGGAPVAPGSLADAPSGEIANRVRSIAERAVGRRGRESA
jgi:hypothetical protein